MDLGGVKPVHDNEEGDRIAALLGDKSILIMASHGVTVVGPTVHDAFDELFEAERTCMYQITAMSTGQKLAACPTAPAAAGPARGATRSTRRLHLDAWRRILDREEPDYAT